MKIYFTASVTGKKEYGENYQMIIDGLRKMGHQVDADLVLESNGVDERGEESQEERAVIHKRIVAAIAGADVVVAEASYPSTNVGHEITLAMDREKPVVVLHVRGKVPVLLLGAAYDRLQVVEYGLDDLDSVLSEAVAYAAERQDTRFNFFISPKIGAYLDWVSRNKRVPRAVYLRNLIKGDMEKSGYKN